MKKTAVVKASTKKPVKALRKKPAAKKRVIKTRPYDVAAYLKSDEDCALYLDAVFEENSGDSEAIARALGDIARARGMTQMARDTGISREGLYKALSGEGKPGFDTILKVIHALGMQIHTAPASARQ